MNTIFKASNSWSCLFKTYITWTWRNNIKNRFDNRCSWSNRNWTSDQSYSLLFVDKISDNKVITILLKWIVNNDTIRLKKTVSNNSTYWQLKRKVIKYSGQLQNKTDIRWTGNMLTNVLSIITDKSMTLNSPLFLFPNLLFVPSK